MNDSVSIVSPIYNDIASMPHILPHLVGVLSRSFKEWEILLIDDRSTDGSREWITTYAKGKKHLRIFFHKNNQGIALTYRELYRRAEGNSVVLFSLDGEWDPRDCVRLVQMLTHDRVDIVIGVRQNKKYTAWRAVVSFLYNRCTRMLFGIDTRDAGSIKAMKKTVIKTIPIISHGVFDEAERIIRAKKAGYQIGYLTIHHNKTSKVHRGIHPRHVFEACFDMWRVFWDIH